MQHLLIRPDDGDPLVIRPLQLPEVPGRTVPAPMTRWSASTSSGVSASSRCRRANSIPWKFPRIMRSPAVRGGRSVRSSSRATRAVVLAPSSWLDVMASSMSELTTYRRWLPRSVTSAPLPIWPLAC